MSKINKQMTRSLKEILNVKDKNKFVKTVQVESVQSVQSVQSTQSVQSVQSVQPSLITFNEPVNMFGVKICSRIENVIDIETEDNIILTNDQIIHVLYEKTLSNFVLYAQKNFSKNMIQNLNDINIFAFKFFLDYHIFDTQAYEINDIDYCDIIFKVVLHYDKTGKRKVKYLRWHQTLLQKPTNTEINLENDEQTIFNQLTNYVKSYTIKFKSVQVFNNSRELKDFLTRTLPQRNNSLIIKKLG